MLAPTMTADTASDAARTAAARAQLAAVRDIRAAGPGSQPETLRTAYLDLLKVALCDLVGATTSSVGATAERAVMSRELEGDGRRLRAAGMDWPLHGLTMIGLERLDDLQACVESVVADGIEGDLVEAGAWRGGASILMRATLDTLGDDRSVWVADSFQGFPRSRERDAAGIDLSAFGFLAVPLEEVRASFARLGFERGVRFVPGFFEETLPPLARERFAIVRLDADTYEATGLALRCLYPGLSVGGHIILDDYGSFEGCRQAVDEFRAEYGIAEPLEKVDHTCWRWRRVGEGPELPTPAAPPPRHTTARPLERAHVPTVQEVELARELAAARATLPRGVVGRLRERLRR
jgi:O-methyltransferase